jgi:hypothetical protein
MSLIEKLELSSIIKLSLVLIAILVFCFRLMSCNNEHDYAYWQIELKNRNAQMEYCKNIAVSGEMNFAGSKCSQIMIGESNGN